MSTSVSSDNNVSNFDIQSSVIRLGKISPLWHNTKNCINFERVHLVFGKILSLFGKFYMVLGNISFL